MSRRALLGGSRKKLVTDLVAGFIHGYSHRKLRNAYTGNAIQVRRSSDNNSENIGFSLNELNESALSTFVGANNGFVANLYDQVGSRDMAQATAANQPQIVNSGTVVKVSGKPYAQYDGSNDVIRTSTAMTSILDKNSTIFIVFESQSSVSVQGVFNETQLLNQNRISIYSDTRASGFLHSTYSPTGTLNLLTYASQQPVSTKRCLILRRNGTTTESYDENNTLIDSVVDSNVFALNTFLELGRQWVGPLFFSGKIAELLINNTALSSGDQTAVLNNIKDFYSIT